jgi:predicted Rdx family selenoprotein
VSSADIEVKRGSSGQFDVFVDGALRFSKHQTGRFPTDAEIDALV